MCHRADTPIYKTQVSESPMPACAGTVIRHLFISRAPLIPRLPSCSLIPLSCSPALSPALPLSSCAPSSSLIPRPVILSHPAPRPAPPILPHSRLLHILRPLTSLFFLHFCFSHNRFFSHIPRFSRNRFFLTIDGTNQRNQNLSLHDSSFSPTVKLHTESPESFYLENQTSTGKAGGQNYKFMK